MTILEQTKSQRKTFTLPAYIVKELETYAIDFGKKQSQIIAIALEEFLNRNKTTNKVNKRMDALDNLIGIAPEGSLKDLDMKEIRLKKALDA
ncbi:MAG: Unknown protein [uncultured Sulfurovum sp.]|uniref:CopG family transcriptional regulator n=1 Tax=uncultured Sulfurovum sp. TaxID=269237 RepID=A0A6S6U5C3_9BACT|nr:MAG: Unknown protein [uncultured Sulfurovum sp.]